MKYNITLNQPLMMEHELNISQWCILDIISIAPTWCTPIIKDGEVYYWIARQKIAEELQALNLKADTIYRYIKQLAELSFIEHFKEGKKDLIRLSEKGKSIFITMSEKNPNVYVGKKSEKNSEKNPTYNNTNSNYFTIDKIDSISENINKESFTEWLEYKRYKVRDKASITKCINFLVQYDKQTQKQIIDTSIMNGWKGLFEPKGNNENITKSKREQTNDLIDSMYPQGNEEIIHEC